QRILEGLEASKKVPFERALYALGIRFVGETVAKKLAKEVISIQNLIEKTKEDLIKIDEIGDRIADSVVDYFSNDEHLKIIDFLEKQGVQFHLSEEQLTNRTEKLAGLNIVISGTFQKFSRDELKKLIEQNGGKNTGSISKNTSYVLAGENMGPSKLERANSLGVPVISEDDFLKMIQD
ncbi:MAG: helix-hairpin-helix domain-containing protein, partial [Mariniphaga sp.]